MTSKQQPANGWTKRIMDALPVATIMLISWICFSIIQLQSKVEVMADNVKALLATKNMQEAATIGANTRRLDELEKGEPAQGGVPIVAAPVTVVNPPDKPVPVETAPKK